MKRKTALFSSLLALLVALSAVPVFAAPPGPTIVDVAIAVNSEGPFAGSFDTLIAALGAADPAVLRTLGGNGQFTVFAPTDDAFEKLNLTPENVGKLPEDALTDILLYHVARGRRYAEDVVGSERIRMLNRGFLFQDAGVLTFPTGSANIIITDVEAANGIIHVIDTVVLP